jgi:hypothetical protein
MRFSCDDLLAVVWAWSVARAPAYPLHVGTIADKIRIGHSITVNCGNRECLHRATLDLEDMAARFGADLLVAELVARAVCSECGARWPRISITISVDSAPRVIPKRETE